MVGDAMLVSDVMVKDVKTIGPEVSVQEAAKIMTENHIGSLVVVKDDEALGIITERDILMKVVAMGLRSSEVLVEDIMTKKLKYITEDKSIDEAADMMVKYRIKKLPVVDKKGNLVGIITTSDLIAFEKKFVEKFASLIVSRKEGGFIGG
jgi:CBS domain-containing protein